MTTKEKIEVMQAFTEGKTIEILDRYNNWHETSKPIWNWAVYNYRIKPELKCRPYNSVEEFLQASKEHGPYLKVINDKGTYQTYVLPLAIVGAYVYFNGAISDNDIKHESVPYTKLLGKYIWQDGTPCGIKEQ